MAFVVKETKRGEQAYKAKIMKPRNLNVLSSKLAVKIIRELGKRPSAAMDVARRLKIHEQNIYYHLRKLENAGVIRLKRTETRVGALAKIYEVVNPFLAVQLFDSEPVTGLRTSIRKLEFFQPFIKNGRMKATIVVGSPDTHGKYGVQASDGSAAIDLALQLGSLTHTTPLPNYKLDTEMRNDDLKDNLILIGGPKANIIIDKINKKMPIHFNTKNGFNIVSTITKNVYPQDDVGIVIKIRNPYAKKKWILVLSGRRFRGTRAAIMAVVKRLKEFKDGETVAHVVKGIDRDADGRVDDAEILE